MSSAGSSASSSPIRRSATRFLYPVIAHVLPLSRAYDYRFPAACTTLFPRAAEATRLRFYYLPADGEVLEMQTSLGEGGSRIRGVRRERDRE